MLLELLARLTPLHVARTEAEREAIFRFRYAIYGRELRRDYPGIDHAKGLLHQEEDDRPETRLFYLGSPREIAGTARARVWDEAPPAIVEELSLQRMPKVKLAYLERTMVRPTLRGRSGMPSILWHGYQHLMSEGVEACVLTCVPGLARHYIRFGARTYGAPLVEGASAAEVPLLILLHDTDHIRKVRSFMLPQFQRLARRFDPAPFAPLVEGPQPVSFEPPAIAHLPVFAGLAPKAVQWIARSAYVLEVPAGGLVVRKGTAEREMYVVLDGALAIDGAPARIGPGEAMGEIGLLGTPGVRTATVRAADRSRLLVLRRRFIDDLAARDPRAAYTVTRNLARLLADRFAQRVG